MRSNTNNTNFNTPISLFRPCNDAIAGKFHILRGGVVELEIELTDNSSKKHVDLCSGHTWLIVSIREWITPIYRNSLLTDAVSIASREGNQRL